MFGGFAAAAVAVGWFLLSSQVAHTDVQTAVSESLGAILVLMLIVSVIGFHPSRLIGAVTVGDESVRCGR